MVTYRGGMARGDMNKYKLLWVDGVSHDKMRWKRFPNENWDRDLDLDSYYPNVKLIPCSIASAILRLLNKILLPRITYQNRIFII